MKKMIVSVLALIVLASAAFAGSVTPIDATLKAVDANGALTFGTSTVTIEGVCLTSFSFDTGRITVYIVDPNTNYGICIDGAKLMSQASTQIPAVGGKLTVRGTMLNYNGLAELVIDTTNVASNFVGTPGSFGFQTTVVTISQLTAFDQTLASGGERYEGSLVRINNVSIDSTSAAWPLINKDANITITDGTNTMVMRIDKESNIDGTTAPVGTFDVIGIVTQYDSSSPYNTGYQIMPRSTDDFPAALNNWEIYSE